VARLPQAQLAELVGVTRKTVNQLLAELAWEGWVAVARGRVEILDAEALGGVARSE